MAADSPNADISTSTSSGNCHKGNESLLFSAVDILSNIYLMETLS